MHTTNEIETAASALANQLAAGINIREAVLRMGKLQPRRADDWTLAAEALSRGGRLSSELSPHWPESVVAAVRAGEESGALDEVFRRTAESMRIRQRVRKIFSKLYSPLISFFAGLGVFLFFMVGVIPKLQSSLGGGEESAVFALSRVMHATVTGYWPLLAGGAVAAVLALVNWLRQPGAVDSLVRMSESIPPLHEALKNLFFGLWAQQISLLDAAGLPVRQQLMLSVNTLPEPLREGVTLMASEVEKRGIADSADPDRQSEEDPRKSWPFYVSNAFVVAHETGRLDAEMSRCAPILLDDGMRQLEKVTAGADLVAKVLAASMIAMPLLAYFSQLSASMTAAFG